MDSTGELVMGRVLSKESFWRKEGLCDGSVERERRVPLRVPRKKRGEDSDWLRMASDRREVWWE